MGRGWIRTERKKALANSITVELHKENFKPCDEDFVKTNEYKEIGRKLTWDIYKRKQLDASKVKLKMHKDDTILRKEINLYTSIKINQHLNERIKNEHLIITEW